MGLSDLPLANAERHAACFERLGWTRDWKRRGRGSHILLTKKGMRATLSIPDHREVKRTVLAGLIRAAGTTQEKYIEEFHK
jgi:predicted RNA binding protein YcfA (HicA-like mRNA interferase family)